ncbi:hypothetical protein BpHYR1_049198 [Brachionus plicatilis]|uniref:Uncharacterized protein n=1 Tax=Brachionus plicatilis TaxID=10195 RepID=A0A3M7QCG4_BRAPC|nr:hypothetical protein BpHYR1_049198 [Brachionus plicatilis]
MDSVMCRGLLAEFLLPFGAAKFDLKFKKLFKMKLSNNLSALLTRLYICNLDIYSKYSLVHMIHMNFFEFDVFLGYDKYLYFSFDGTKIFVDEF